MPRISESKGKIPHPPRRIPACPPHLGRLDEPRRHPPAPPRKSAPSSRSSFQSIPKGGVCHHKTISRRDYLRPNESQTDFAYTLALARRGYSDQQIRKRLLAERTCWENHRGERKRNLYLDRTIRRAREIIETTRNSGRFSAAIGPSDSSSTGFSTETLLDSQNKVKPTPFSPE